MFFAAALLFTLSVGCGENNPNDHPGPGGGTSKPRVVCTIFPIYDWARNILGDKAGEFDITLLLGNKADLHSYQPSVDDIVKITACDLFIYVGGESDGWVDGVLAQSKNPDMIAISLIEALGDGVKLEEIIAGMQDDEHDHDEHDEAHDEHDHDDDHDHDDEAAFDEHVWLSLRNAQIFCSALADALAQLDAENAQTFETNASAYISKLAELDEEYKKVTDAAPSKVLLFGDRFPFRYLTDDYGIDYYAAFPGCSAETEASFDTVIFLAEKTDELGLSCVMVTESSDKEVARTIINNTGNKDRSIHILDAMQSISASDIQGGATYLGIMESNLDVLRQALR